MKVEIACNTMISTAPHILTTLLLLIQHFQPLDLDWAYLLLGLTFFAHLEAACFASSTTTPISVQHTTKRSTGCQSQSQEEHPEPAATPTHVLPPTDHHPHYSQQQQQQQQQEADDVLYMLYSIDTGEQGALIRQLGEFATEIIKLRLPNLMTEEDIVDFVTSHLSAMQQLPFAVCPHPHYTALSCLERCIGEYFWACYYLRYTQDVLQERLKMDLQSVAICNPKEYQSNIGTVLMFVENALDEVEVAGGKDAMDWAQLVCRTFFF